MKTTMKMNTTMTNGGRKAGGVALECIVAGSIVILLELSCWLVFAVVALNVVRNARLTANLAAAEIEVNIKNSLK